LIFQKLSSQFYQIYDVKATDRTIKKRFNDKWKLSKRIKFDDGKFLRASTIYLFYIFNINNDTILEIIRENKFIIKIKKTLADVRKKEGLYRRITNSEKNNRRAIEFLTELLQNDHPIDNKDRTFLLETIRKKGLIITK
jgi:hypothetical protein